MIVYIAILPLLVKRFKKQYVTYEGQKIKGGADIKASTTELSTVTLELSRTTFKEIDKV
jgi:hypothetical protein